MAPDLSPEKDAKLVPIGEAAEILGVSIDTVRRWDKKGILHSSRPDGKRRFFSVEELERVKFARPLTITQAAQQLGVSADTLRRLEDKGIITPERNNKGERLYTQEVLKKYLDSEYFMRQKEVQEKILEPLKDPEHRDDLNEVRPSKELPTPTLETEQKVITQVLGDTKRDVTRLDMFRRAFYAGGVFLGTTAIIAIIVITGALMLWPEATGGWFGFYRVQSALVTQMPSRVSALGGQVLGIQQDIRGVSESAADIELVAAPRDLSVPARVLQPFGRVSLELVKQFNKQAYDRAITVVTPEFPAMPESLFITLEDGTIIPRRPLTFDTTSDFIIPDHRLVENLNAQYLQGHVPGTEADNLLLLNSEGNIEFSGFINSESVTTSSLVDQSVTSDKIAVGVINSLHLGPGSVTRQEIKDGEVLTDELADTAVTEDKIASEAVTEAKIAEGAVTAIKISNEAVHSIAIKNGTIIAEDIANGAIITEKLANNAVTTEKIKNGEVGNADLADDSVTTTKIREGGVTTTDIAEGAVGSTQIKDGGVENVDVAQSAIESDNIADNNVSAADLAAALTFADGDFLDLAAITHDDAAPQGLRLPNVASGTPTSPSSGEGYVAWNTAGNEILLYDGSSWVGLTSTGGIGDITRVGDCTAGECFSGTQGTTLTFNDADGDGVLTIADLTAARTWTLPNASGTVIVSGHTFTGDVTGTVDSDGSTALTTARINGATLGTTTATAGNLLLGDGDSWESVAMSGDITITSAGVASIGADKVTEADLKMVNAGTDEYCLTYETTTGDFEWEHCIEGSGGLSAFTVAGDSGMPQSITDGDTLTLATGPGLSTEASATDTITFRVDNDAFDFDEFEDTLDLDAALVINQGAQTWAQNYTGTTDDGYTYTATSLTTGTGLDFNVTNAATTNTAIEQVQFDLTNAQSTLANASFVGYSINFSNTPSVAGNTEIAARIQNQQTGNTTDNAVTALLLLDNADTSAAGSTVVTDALRITNSGGIAGGVVNAINIASTSITTDISLQNGETIDNDTDGRVLITATTTETSGNLTVSGTSGISIAGSGGDITFANGEKIDNDTDGTVAVTGNASVSGDLTVTGNDVVFGNAETIANSTDGTIAFTDGTNTLMSIVDQGTTGNVNISGDLTISGDDLFMATNTSGFILVADGTNYNPVAVSGDATLSSSGAFTIDADEIDFDQMEDTMDLDANLTLNQSTNTWTQNFTGDTTTGYTYNANSLTTGDALSIVSTATGITSGELLNIDLTSSGSLSSKTGNLASVAGSRTNTATTGTVADDYDLLNLTRTSVQNGASGTLTATGSVLRLENVATQTAGTLTDSARVLEIVQDADSSGNSLAIAHGGSGNAFFVGDDGTLTDSTPFVVDAAGNVGIGTASPGAKLYLQDTAATVRINNTSINATTGLEFYINGSFLSGVTHNMNSGEFKIGAFSGGGHYLTFYEDGNERMRIDSAGNVGIATTGPDRILDVLAAAAPQLRLTQADGTVYSEMQTDSSGNLAVTTTGTTVTFTGDNVTVGGDLTISGDDLFMATNTSGYLLIADGTNFNPVAMSGDITIDSTGATAIGADKVTEADLKAVNGGTDEYCLTYETTTGDFEWEDCVEGDGGLTSFTLAGDAGTPQTISNNDTLTVATSTHLTATAAATDTVTISVDDDTFDFDQFQDTLDLDAALVLNQGTNTWTQNFTGTTGDGYTYNANSLTTGDALSIVSTATGITSGELLNIDLTSSGSLSAKTGNLTSVASSRTNTATSGTVADDYDLFALTRTSVQNGASGTLTAAGSVLRLENVATQTAGTLTDSARVLEIAQDADSSGDALAIAHAGSGYALRINDDGTLTDSTPFVVEADGDVGIGTASPATLLHLNTAAGSSPTLRLTDADVAHGITLFGRTTDTIYDVSAYSATSGGAIHWGMSSAASIPALTFWGVVGNTSPSVAPVAFSAGKKNGSTVQPLASAEKAYTFYNSADGDIPGATLLTILGGGNVGIGSTSPEALLEIQGAEATDAVIALDADDGDDAADTWFIKSLASGNSLSILNDATEVFNLSSGGNLQIDGDLTISGDDLVMGTNTSGFILVADGTNFNPVAVSGDITLTSAGVTAIGDDKVTEADLKVVDAGADEECLTYETTTGDFEWEPCVSGAGGISSFTLAGDTGTPQTISDSDTLTVATGTHLTATAGATDTVTLSVDDDTFDFDQFQDTLDLDAALTLNQGTNTWTQNFTGTTGDGLTYNANSLTTGDALSIVSTATGMTSGELLNIDLTSSGSLSAKTGNLTSVAGSRTNTATTGTVADDYDLLALTRTNVQNGAGGTLTAAGSVLRLENVATQTAGTLTDSARVLEIVQDADSSGNSLGIAHAGSGDAIFIGDDGTLTDSTPFVIQADGDVGIGVGTPTYGKVEISTPSLGTTAMLAFSTPDGTYNPRAIISHVTASNDHYVNFDSSYSTGAGFADWIFSNGSVGIGDTSPDAQLDIVAGAATTKGLIVQGAVSASANLFEAQDSSGNAVVTIGTSAAGSKYRLVANNAEAGGAKSTSIQFGGGGYLDSQWSETSRWGSGVYADAGTLKYNTDSGNFVGALTLGSGAFRYQNGTSSGSGNTASLTERLTVDASGLVGINDAAPDASLEVVNDGSGDSFLVADTNDGDTTPFVIQADGDVGIGTASPGAKLDVAGGSISIDAGQELNADGNNQNAVYISTTSMELSNQGDVVVDLDSDNNSSSNAFKVIHANSSANEVFRVQEDGNVGINDTTPDALFDIDSAATTGTVSGLTATALTTGKALHITSSSGAITSGELFTTALTSSGSLSAKSGNLTSIAGSRTNTATTGTVADDYDLLNLTRTSVQNGASGTLTAAGSVLRLENVATQTAGTLTDTAKILELVQDADSTGAVIHATNAGTGNDLQLVNTNAGADGVSIVFHHDSASPAAADVLADIDFSGEDSLGNETDYAQIQTISTVVTDGSEDGELAFSAMLNGTLTEAFRIDDQGYVGIGTTAPNEKLEVASGNIRIGAADNYLAFGSSNMRIQGSNSGGNLDIVMGSAAGTAGGNNTGIRIWSNALGAIRTEIDSSGNIQTDGDLTISGDDLVMATNTSGYLLVADGTNFNPVAMSGDITIDSAGITAIGADKVTEADLKVVNGATDEYCFTYEATTGDFEWEECVSGAGGLTSFTLAGDAGTPQTISDGNTLTVATGAGLTATASATDTVTISVDEDAFDFDEFEDTLDLDAALTLNQSTNTWTQNFTGDTSTGLTYNANSLTTGKALNITSSSGVITSGELFTTALTSSGSSLAAKTGNLASVSSSRTETRTTGTTADDYDLLGLTRTSVMNGSGGTLTAAGSVLRLENVATQTAGTLTDTTKGLEIVMDADGTGDGIFIDSNAATAIALNIDAENTTTDIINVDGAVLTTGQAVDITALNALTTGKGLNISSASGVITSGELFTAALTSSGSSLAVKTGNLASVSSSRTETRTTGTTADDYDVVSFTRTNVMNGSGGTLTAAGSVLRLENVATQTAGTLTDSAQVLEIVQDADSSGDALAIAHAGSGYALRVNDDGTLTDSTPFVVEADGDVAIGTTSLGTYTSVPARLEIQGTSHTGLAIDSGNDTLADLILVENGTVKWHLLNRGDSSDRFEIFASSSEAKFTLLQTGEVGLDDVTPDAHLEVVNDGSGDSFLVADTNDGDTSPFVINSSGVVGIGTASPSNKLHIAQDITAADFTAGSTQFHITGATDTTESLMFGFETENNYAFIQGLDRGVSFSAYNLALMPKGGNVGIGDTTPDALLDVGGNAQLDGDLTILGDDLFMTTNTSGFILVADGTNYNPVAVSGDATLSSSGVFTIDADEIDFDQMEDTMDLDANLAVNTTGFDVVWNEDGGDSDFRIEGDTDANLFFADASTDRIGIGTASPETLLHLHDPTGASVDPALIIGGTLNAVNAGHSIDFRHTSTTASYARIAGVTDSGGTTGELSLWTSTGLGTAATEKVRITGAGLVGIMDTTPDASLEVVNDGSGDSFLVADTNDGDTSPFVIQADGDVGIGVASPGALVDIDRPDASSITAEQIGLRVANTAQTLTDGTSITNWRNVQMIAPTLNGVAAGGTETVTNAATAYIDAAPSGSNITITNPYAFWVDNGAVRFDNESLGTTSTDGLALINNTAAAAGAQQYSPRLRLTGQGWKTDATAASQTVDFILQTVPVQGTANPTAYLDFSKQVNGGGYSNALAITSAGNVGIGTTAPASLLHLANAATGVAAITLDTPGAQNVRLQTIPAVNNWGAFTLNSNFNGSAWDLDETGTNGWFFKLDTRGGNGDSSNNGLWLFRIPNGANPHTDESAVFGITNGRAYFAGNVGIGTTGPDRILDVLAAAAPQLRLTQADGTVYAEMQTDSSGNLAVATTGTTVTFTSDNVTVGGDLTISGDDLFMATNTSGHILVADGTNYNPVAVSGDATLSSAGALVIDADEIDFDQMEDTMDLDAALVLNQTTNTWTQSFTGTTTTGLDYSALSLTSGTALDLNATNTHTADAAIQQVRFDLTNAQATVANTNFAGLAVNFTNNPTIAGNTENVFRIQNQATSNVTDNAVATLLRLDNADTATVGSTVVTDALLITNSGDIAGGITNAINIDDTDVTNDLVLQNDEVMHNNTDGTIAFTDGTNTLFSIVDAGTTGNVTASGDLTITGDDLFMTTNTSGFILVADGTNYNPVAMSGDITILSTGATSIGADKVLEADLKAVDAAVDEECLTFETTTGDFEWQTCGGAIAADSLDFIDFEDTMDLDAALTLNQGTNTWSQSFTGTTTTGLTYTASSLTTGKALQVTATNTATTATSVVPVSFDLTNAHATSAGTYAGIKVQFLSNPTVAGNTEEVLYVSNFATSNTTDNAVAALLRLDNADTSTTGSTVVTDGIRITNSGNIAAGITNAINIDDADITNDIVLQNDEVIHNDTDGTVAVTGGILRLGTGSDTAGNRSTVVINNGGYAIPAAAGGTSNGDKLVLYDPGASYRVAIGMNASARMWFQASSTSAGGFSWHAGSSPTELMVLQGDGSLGVGDTSPDATFDVDSTATTTNAAGILATSLTTGQALELTATNTATTNTAIEQVEYILTNAQATLANSNFVGLAIDFTNNPTIAGNTENVVRIQNQVTANATDNAVAALLYLDNADTTATGSTVVTNAILVQNTGNIAAGVTNGINFDDTDITNDIVFQNDEVLRNNLDGTIEFLDDVAGNTLFSITDAGTTGNITATGTATATDFICTSGDCLDFTEFEDTMDLDAALTLNQGANSITQNFTGTTNLGLLYIASSLTTGKAMEIYSNSADTSTRDLMVIYNDNALATGTKGLAIWQDAAATGLFIDENGNGIALDIDAETTTADIVNISAAPLTTGIALDIPDGDALTTGKLLNLTSNSASTSARTLVAITNDNTLATSATALTLKQDAAGAKGLVFDINSDQGAHAISIESTTSTGRAIDITGTYISSGNGLRIDGSNLGDFSTYNFTGDLIQVSPARTHNAANTMTSSGNWLELNRSQTINNATGTINITGSLAYLYDNCTVTAGTCTNSAKMLEINQDYASATGSVLYIDNDGTGDSIEVISTATEVFTVEDSGRIFSNDLTSPGSTTLCYDGVGGSYIGACSSSLEFKDNVTDLSFGLETLMKLRPREFDWKESVNGQHDLGFIAQEVAAVEPLLATYINGEINGVKYMNISALLAKAIQEQQGQIMTLADLLGADLAALSVQAPGQLEATFASRLNNLEERVAGIESERSLLDAATQPEAAPEVTSTLPTNVLTDALFSEDLVFSGALTADNNVTINGMLTVKANVSFLATLFADTVKVAQSLTVEGDTTIFGKLTAESDVQVKGTLSLSEQQAGFAAIPRGGNTVAVTYPKAYIEAPLVQITPQAPIGGGFWISAQSATGFSITLERLSDTGVTFNWFTLPVAAPATAQGQALDSDGDGILDIDEQAATPTPETPATTPTGEPTAQPVVEGPAPAPTTPEAPAPTPEQVTPPAGGTTPSTSTTPEGGTTTPTPGTEPVPTTGTSTPTAPAPTTTGTLAP